MSEGFMHARSSGFQKKNRRTFEMWESSTIQLDVKLLPILLFEFLQERYLVFGHILGSVQVPV